MGALDRVRSNPKLAVAIAGGTILLLAWIGWAIHVASDNGGRAALGVLIAWPAMLAALALLSLIFIGCYRLVRRLSAGEQDRSTATAGDEAPADQDEEPEDSEGDSDDQPEDDEEDGEEEDEAESDPEQETSAKS